MPSSVNPRAAIGIVKIEHAIATAKRRQRELPVDSWDYWMMGELIDELQEKLQFIRNPTAGKLKTVA